MAPAHLRLPKTALDYGPTCPNCAGPKAVQASMCQGCWFESRRDEEFWARRTCGCGNAKWIGSARCRPCADLRLVGNTHAAGRSPAAGHSWRAA